MGVTHIRQADDELILHLLSSEEKKEEEKEEQERKREKETVTERIRRIAASLHVRRDDRDNVYIFVPDMGYLPLEGARAKDWLVAHLDAHDLQGQEHLRRLIMLLRAQSLQREQIIPRKRVHVLPGEVRINLGDGRFVRIRPEKITIAKTNENVPFLASVPHLPAPLIQKDPDRVRDEFFSLLGLAQENSWTALGWLGATLACEAGYGLLLQGPPGAGKTVITRLLAWLIDGGDWMSRAAQAEMKEIAALAKEHEVIGLDNISHLNAQESDILAQVVTGLTWQKRRLYSDADLFSVSVRAKLILNGVDISGIRSDLLSRLIPLQVPPRDNPVPEAEIKERAEQLRPRLLGALAQAIQAYLRSPHPRNMPPMRLPDWGHAFYAILRFLGHPAPEKILTKKLQQSEEEDKLLNALLLLLDEEEEVHGYASEIVEKLKRFEIEVSPIGLGKLLRYVETALYRRGIVIERKLVEGKTKYRIYRTELETTQEEVEELDIDSFDDFPPVEQEETAEETAKPAFQIKRTCETCNWYAPSLNTPTCWVHPGEVKRLPAIQTDCELWQPDDRLLAVLNASLN